MSVGYRAVQWNPFKKRFDLALAGLLLLGLGVFIAVTAATHPEVTIEMLIIRGTAVAAFVLLHIILCIGPLARLDRRFLPLLYNRRHLGVVMFGLALVHAVLAVFLFHTIGDRNPLVSVFTAYARDYDPFVVQSANIAHFPFEPLGAAALFILFLMAATSHDFWLANLGASWWKTLHILALIAYGLLVLHVAFGALQSETHPVYPALLAVGVAAMLGLHLAAARREAADDRAESAVADDGFVPVCAVDDLVEGRGTVAKLSGDRIAVYLVDGKVFATANVCRHQGGPLGEGRIIDGCITCPWHGWQYRPEDGRSPPPFEELIETYQTAVRFGVVMVRAPADPPGTAQSGAPVEEE